MEDVFVDLVRHDSHPPEDTPNYTEASLLGNDPTLGDDVDCTQQSLGSMGLHDDDEMSNDDIQVLFINPFLSLEIIEYLYYKMLSLNLLNLSQRNLSNVVLLRRACYPG